MGRLTRGDARLTSVSRGAGDWLNLTAVGGAERPVRDPVRLRSLRAGSTGVREGFVFAALAVVPGRPRITESCDLADFRGEEGGLKV